MNQTRRQFVRSVAAATTIGATATGVSGASGDGAGTVSVAEEFGGQIGEWAVRSELSTAAAADCWSASVVGSADATDRAVEFVADGRAGSGMIWVYAPVEVDPGTAYRGTASVRMWSPGVDDRPLSKLHVALTPEEPTEAADFPTGQDAWRYQGERGGLVRSLWTDAGWTDYTCHWESEEMADDRLYVAVGVSTTYAAKFVHYLDAVDVSLTPVDGGSDAAVPAAEDATVRTLDDPVADGREILFDEDADTVTVRGTTTVRSGCREPVVDEVAYDADADELAVELGSVATEDVCTQQLRDVGYELTVDCPDGLPASVTVATPDGGTVSAAREPTLVDVTLTETDGEADGTLFDDTTDTVRVEDVATLRDGCEGVAVAAADVDAAASAFSLDVDVVRDGDAVCTQQVVDQRFAVEATFADGLPGTVDYDGPN